MVSGKQVMVERWEGGKAVDRDTVNPTKKSQRLKVGKALGVDDVTLLGWFDSVTDAAAKGDSTPKTFHTESHEEKVGNVIVRDLDAADTAPDASYPLDPAAVIRRVIAATPQQKLVKWWDKEVLCCLDIDYHEGVKTPKDWLAARVTCDLAPRPFAWHFSKAGGLHLFYIASDPFTAEELAAAAALCWRRLDALGQVELKTGVRGAGDEPVHFSPGGEQDTRALLVGWTDRTDAEDAQVEEWLDSNNLERGKRYGHTKCPIFPTPGYESTGEPVCVGDKGVFCFRCEGESRSIGCRKPGFAPFGALIGSPGSGDLGLMLRNMTPWGHARLVLTVKYRLPEGLARAGYSAALKCLHHGTPKVAMLPLVFHKNTDKIARVNGEWRNVSDNKPYTNEGAHQIVSRFPDACVLDADTQLPKPDPSSVAVLTQPHDLTHRGFPEVTTIHGMRLSQQYMAEPSREPAMVEVLPQTLERAGPRFAPRYVPKSRRNTEEAWGQLREVFPGIDRRAVELVICAIAVGQETKLGMHPYLFIAGPSGSAKTTTVKIASRIVGGTFSEFYPPSSDDQWNQRMLMCCRQGAVVVCNELVKETRRNAGRNREFNVADAFLPFLGLTPSTPARELYQPPREFGRLPAFVATEPNLPVDLSDEEQVARRWRFLQLVGQKDWTPQFVKYGFDDSISTLRTHSVQMADMCNAIVSDIIDRHFVTPKSWDEMAESYDVKPINRNENFQNLTPWMREFYRLVCLAPTPEKELERKRFPAHKKIVKPLSHPPQGVPADPLADVYSMFADGMYGQAWRASRRLTEKDWSKVLKTGEPVHLSLTDDGANVFVKFYVGPRSKPVKVNGEILPVDDWTSPEEDVK